MLVCRSECLRGVHSVNLHPYSTGSAVQKLSVTIPQSSPFVPFVPPAASHDSPRAQTCTFEGPGLKKNTTKIQREDPREREKKQSENGCGRGKKESEILGSLGEGGPGEEGPWAQVQSPNRSGLNRSDLFKPIWPEAVFGLIRSRTCWPESGLA